MIRKASAVDIDSVVAIYDKVLRMEEQGLLSIGWQRGVYPTRQTALDALGRGDLYVCDDGGAIVAAAVINHVQMDSYAGGKWKVAASGSEVMVLHTLVVSPDFSGRGVGRKFVGFYEQLARKEHCKDLRMDTQAKNQRARRLYNSLGYDEIGIVSCNFNGIKGIELVLLEKAVEI